LTNSGPLVEELERRIADFLGVGNCVTMVNGTVALEIAIRALGLSGEVIVPSFTFVATAHALHWQGITPVFADIDEDTHTLDPESVRRMITPRTSGIIGVHLWGRGADAAALQAIADEFGLQLLFDAAHAFGVSQGGRMIGSFGRAEVLSFHATKFFNTFEGGAVVTNDDELAEKMRLMRNFGFSGNDNVIHPGTNGKMAEVCAAMGLVNLDSLDDFVATNRANHEAYREILNSCPALRFIEYPGVELNNYQYAVVELLDADCAIRDRVIGSLVAENVLARRYFWPGVHRMQPYRDLYPHAGLLLPNTKVVADRVIVLPTGTAMTPERVREVAGRLLAALAAATPGTMDLRPHRSTAVGTPPAEVRRSP
jgi:dTDP-4-amino-4,6-dideoxygalactose transaminase